MDYEKKYKEALEKARCYYTGANGNEDMITMTTTIFPELKESEGERIRKELLDFCENRAENYPNDPKYRNISSWIAWLKKQGEQKPAWSEEDVKMIGTLVAIFEVNYPNDLYKVNPIGTTNMQGIYSSEIIKWLKSLKDRVQPKQEWSEEDKEVINLLLELVYEQDKMSPRIPSNEKRKMMLSWLKSLKPQSKQEWSEEDVRNIQDIDSVLFYDKNLPEDTCVRLRNWLKSLKPQNKWKPSEEQMEALLYEVNAWDEDSANGQNLKSLYQNLKKLREE